MSEDKETPPVQYPPEIKPRPPEPQGLYQQFPPPPPGGYPQYPPCGPRWPYPPYPPVALPQAKADRLGSKLGLAGWSLLLLIPLGILLTIFILLVFVGKPYIVHGSSMEPSLHEGDRVFVVAYRLNTEPDRGDVVVLKKITGSPDLLIKRVVAIAGDTITRKQGSLVVNGKYKHKDADFRYGDPRYGSPDGYTQEVPKDHVFVMGDNQEHSFDSRSFGPVPMNKVVGKALLVFWPLGDIKNLRNANLP